jgi:methionyl-tRNA formyltransferase
MVMRLVFMGTPQFAVPSLKKLLGSSHQIVATFTQPDRPAGRGERITAPAVKVLAEQHGIQLHQPEKLKEEIWKKTFQQQHADAFVVVAFGKILPRWLLEIPSLGAFNLHASLLPKYRGAAPVQWAVANGESETGVTTMKLDQGMDTGDILLQERVRIGSQETAVDLQERLAGIGADLLLHTINLLESNELHPIKQDSTLATYAPSLKKEDGLICWEQSTAHEVYNRIRAFNPWPGTYTLINGQVLRIWSAIPQEVSVDAHSPGTLVQVSSEGPVVVCARGFLRLVEVQLENRRRMSATEMLHGLRITKNQPVSLGK